MPVLLFKLSSHVPDDEAEDIRCLLEEHAIDFYETDAGRWRIGVAALWLRDESQLDDAQALIRDYQQQRYQQAVDNPMSRSWWDVLRESPLQLFMTLLSVLIVLGVSVLPFVW